MASAPGREAAGRSPGCYVTPIVYVEAAARWAAASPTLVNACLGAGVELPIVERAVAEVPRIYYQPADWRIMAGALNALTKTCVAGFTNVILSNHAPELPGLVDALGFASHVERTITSASLGVEKPNPIIFRTALRLVDGAPDSWMIGDNPSADVEGAQAVGMRAMLVHRSIADMPSLTLEAAAARVVGSLPRVLAARQLRRR